MLFICTSLSFLNLRSTVHSFLSNKSLLLKFLHLCISSHLSPAPYFWSICLYRTEKLWVFSIIIIISFNAIDLHSSTLAWKIPWMEKRGRLQVHGVAESDTTEPLQGHWPSPQSKIPLYLIAGSLYLQFLHIHSLTSMDSTNYRSSSSVLFTFEKHSCISKSVWFKPVLSKDQLC